jgi:hypothetical protein
MHCPLTHASTNALPTDSWVAPDDVVCIRQEHDRHATIHLWCTLDACRHLNLIFGNPGAISFNRGRCTQGKAASINTYPCINVRKNTHTYTYIHTNVFSGILEQVL